MSRPNHPSFRKNPKSNPPEMSQSSRKKCAHLISSTCQALSQYVRNLRLMAVTSWLGMFLLLSATSFVFVLLGSEQEEWFLWLGANFTFLNTTKWRSSHAESSERELLEKTNRTHGVIGPSLVFLLTDCLLNRNRTTAPFAHKEKVVVL